MFLDSTYQPKEKQKLETLSIYDIAVLTAQIGDKPIITHQKHLTSGMIQLVCYFAQGAHITRTGRSLFKEDFYIIDNRIENPKITNLFGAWNKRATPFVMKEEIKALLSKSGFNTMNNKLCQEVVYDIVPRNYKDVMASLRETKPYTEALKDPYKRISKKEIKEFFESQMIKPTEISNITIGV